MEGWKKSTWVQWTTLYQSSFYGVSMHLPVARLSIAMHYPRLPRWGPWKLPQRLVRTDGSRCWLHRHKLEKYHKTVIMSSKRATKQWVTAKCKNVDSPSLAKHRRSCKGFAVSHASPVKRRPRDKNQSHQHSGRTEGTPAKVLNQDIFFPILNINISSSFQSDPRTNELCEVNKSHNC